MESIDTPTNPTAPSGVGRFDSNEAARLHDLANSNLANPDAIKSVVESTVDKASEPLVNQARKQSIQLRGSNEASYISSAISNIFQAADTLPPWWSVARDQALSDLWKVSDLLGGAMYMMASKMSTIPFHVEARDMSITAHLQDAARFERKLNESSEWGTGWGQFFQKQVESLLGQDNGRFMEIIDLSRNKSQAIKGPAISVAHLDPSRCTRTSDPTFPVVYRRTDGKLFKLHWTRVAFEAQLPSERVDMYGVGLCAVSRSASYVRHMLDIAQYKEEKLGSRPMRGILTVGGGLDPEMVGQAFAAAAGMADSKGLKRFAWMPVIGSPDIEEPTVELTSLSSLPDQFDEQKSTEIAMAAIALAFGVDARELWPGMQAASTRADALLSHIKQRGKGPGHILQETERMFNNYFLPPYLKLVFDFQDDAQDRQKAEIRKERSATRMTDLSDGISDKRTERERMVNEGELRTAQFETIELADGRLPDGTPIQVLFFRDEPIYTDLLTLSAVSDPLDFRTNDPETTLDQIVQNLSRGYGLLATETRQIQKRQIQQSLAALKFIQSEYEQIALIEEAQELAEQEVAQVGTPASSSDTPVNPESEEPINQRPDDEDNLSALENSPRELTGKAQLMRKQTRQSKGLQTVLSGLENLVHQEETPPPVIHFSPLIEVNLPDPAPINITVEPADIPEIIVPQAPINIEVQPTPIEVTVESPNIEIRPDLPALPPITKEAKYEIVEILERDDSGNVKKMKRERVDD